MTRKRGEWGEIGLEWRGRDLSGYVCYHCPADITLMFVKAFLKWKSEKERMRYAVWTRSEWARKKEWREIEMKKRLRNFLFYRRTTQSANEPHRDILHCCQDLYRSILFSSNEYIIFNILNICTVHDETKEKLNVGNACYRSIQNPLSSRMLLKISRFKMCAAVVLLVLYDCQPWSPTLRKRHRLKVPENRMLRTFVSKKEEITGDCRESHNERLHNFASSNQDGCDRLGT